MKKLTFVFFTLILSFILIACDKKQEQKGQKIQGENKSILKIGTSGGYFPFSFYENDELKGFEIDIWNEIAKKLNKKVEFTTSKFSGLFGLLDTQKIDTISNQITITQERKKKYNFPKPYVYDGAVIIVHKDTNDINNIQDLKGKKVGVGLGTNYAQIISKLDVNSEIQVITYDGNGYQQDVKLRRIAAYIEDRTSAVEAIKKGNLPLKVVGKPLSDIENSFPFLKTDKGDLLLAKVDKVLEELRQDGTLNKLSQKWFDTDITTK